MKAGGGINRCASPLCTLWHKGIFSRLKDYLRTSIDLAHLIGFIDRPKQAFIFEFVWEFISM